MSGSAVRNRPESWLLLAGWSWLAPANPLEQSRICAEPIINNIISSSRSSSRYILADDTHGTGVLEWSIIVPRKRARIRGISSCRIPGPGATASGAQSSKSISASTTKNNLANAAVATAAAAATMHIPGPKTALKSDLPIPVHLAHGHTHTHTHTMAARWQKQRQHYGARITSPGMPVVLLLPRPSKTQNRRLVRELRNATQEANRENPGYIRITRTGPSRMAVVVVVGYLVAHFPTRGPCAPPPRGRAWARGKQIFYILFRSRPVLKLGNVRELQRNTTSFGMQLQVWPLVWPLVAAARGLDAVSRWIYVGVAEPTPSIHQSFREPKAL
uniref:Putative secreted protein n=1 Tax=Anopheles triannulatus TaxID=58253 RepID=A0A2M4B2J9_9DIPT